LADLLGTTIDAEEDTLKGRFLTFQIGKEVYGIEIKYVTEIIGIQATTEMPEMPEYIKGIINLRGKIIPIMDIRLRFRKEPKEYDDRTCIIVVDYNTIPMGFVVDSVAEVLSIADQNISEMPSFNVGAGNGFVKNIGKIGSDVVLLLDYEKLITSDEIESISEMIN
jgi:purine-binding chemotaxis protein CheW